EGIVLRLAAARGLDIPPDFEAVPLASAPAFASAAESRDTIVAMRSRGELSESIARILGEAPGRRFALFPVAHGDHIMALLYADSQERQVDTSGLELLAAMAGAPVAPGRQADLVEQADLVQIDVAKPAPESQDRTRQALRLRAQRFARLQVAQ